MKRKTHTGSCGRGNGSARRETDGVTSSTETHLREGGNPSKRRSKLVEGRKEVIKITEKISRN